MLLPNLRACYSQQQQKKLESVFAEMLVVPSELVASKN
jgi:hypothetical protein